MELVAVLHVVEQHICDTLVHYSLIFQKLEIHELSNNALREGVEPKSTAEWRKHERMWFEGTLE